jgi:hypothetical protein
LDLRVRITALGVAALFWLNLRRSAVVVTKVGVRTHVVRMLPGWSSLQAGSPPDVIVAQVVLASISRVDLLLDFGRSGGLLYTREKLAWSLRNYSHLLSSVEGLLTE